MVFCSCLKYSITIIVRQFKAVSILLHRRSHRTGWGGPDPPTFGIVTLDPPNFWDSNMGPPMGPPHGTLMGSPKISHGKNRAGKFHQLPPPNSGTPSTTPPLEFTDLIDYPPPPRNRGRKTPSTTTPPRIHGTSSTTPPLEIDLDPPNFWSVAAPLFSSIFAC